MGERYVLGVDGGNTKTVAAVARLDGTIVGVGRGGCSDIYAASSIETALEEVGMASSAAIAGTDARREDLIACAFSMAGADWPEDIALLDESLAARGYGGRITVVNDAMGALRAGSEDGTGVAVVCGTGAAIGARASNGRQWHTGWWQEPQGSRHLAEKTLRAVYRAELGIDPPTGLTRRVLEIIGEQRVEGVLHRMTTREKRTVVNHGAVTTALLEEADSGDCTAARIVQEHGRSLGDYAIAAAARTGISESEFVLVLTGGVFRNRGSLLRDCVVERVREVYPRIRPGASPHEPVVGALLLALESAGAEVSGDVMSRLHGTIPA